MIVVDASSWLDALRGKLPPGMLELLEDGACASPPHVDFEVGNAAIRLERRGVLESGKARDLIEAFSRNPVERIFQPIDAVYAVELLDNATFADAWYIALAKRLSCPLMTTDAGMKTAARMHHIRVIDQPSAS